MEQVKTEVLACKIRKNIELNLSANNNGWKICYRTYALVIGANI